MALFPLSMLMVKKACVCCVRHFSALYIMVSLNHCNFVCSVCCVVSVPRRGAEHRAVTASGRARCAFHLEPTFLVPALLSSGCSDKCHRLGDRQQTFFSHSSGGWEFKIKLPADSCLVQILPGV